MPKIAVSDETLLLSGVVYPESGCWLRLLGVRPGTVANGGGYSRLYRAGKTVYAHRLSYEIYKGPIPEGFTIDHLCRVRNCVNPEHLEAVCQRTNVLRGEGASARNAAKTHCPKGHPYDYITAQGSRWCSICRASAERRYYNRHRRAKRGI